MQVRIFYCVSFSSMGVSIVDFCPAVSNPHIWNSDPVFWAASFPAQPFLEYFEFLLAVHYLGHGALARPPWALHCSSPLLAGCSRILGKEKKYRLCAIHIKEKWSFYCCKILLRRISKAIGGKVLKFTAVFLDATDFEDVHILYPNQMFC